MVIYPTGESKDNGGNLKPPFPRVDAHRSGDDICHAADDCALFVVRIRQPSDVLRIA